MEMPRDWKTTLGGLVSGLAAIFGGIESIRQDKAEQGYTLIIGGIALIYKGWYSVDKK